jgi:GDP-4-dehydro-6-deoxy-D-mannose reductase
MTPPLRILVTGATGFTGSHLSELALAKGHEVFGFARRDDFGSGVNGQVGDITRRDHLEACLARCRPDWIFHLAAIVHGTTNAPDPDAMLRVNIGGTHSLLEAVRTIAPWARVLVAGSSGIYGQPANPSLPISESAPLQPRSTYALSKAAQDLMAQQFFLEHGLHVVRGRTFNQTGPREPEGLVCSGLASQVARIEVGRQDAVLRVISLETARDFCDVRDIVAGYWGALAHGAPGEAYNICSGISHRIRQVVDLLLAHAHAGKVSIDEINPHPGSHAILNQVGDSTRLRACSGWSPSISLAQSLGDLLEEWRHKIRREM